MLKTSQLGLVVLKGADLSSTGIVGVMKNLKSVAGSLAQAMAYSGGHKVATATVHRSPMIPTFINELPASPTKRPIRQSPSITAKPLQAAAAPQFVMHTSQLPSVVLEQTAEDDRDLSAAIAATRRPFQTTTVTATQLIRQQLSQQAVEDASVQFVSEVPSESQTADPLTTPGAISAMLGTNRPVLVQVTVQMNNGVSVPIQLPADVVAPALLAAISGNTSSPPITPTQLLTVQPSPAVVSLPVVAENKPIKRAISTTTLYNSQPSSPSPKVLRMSVPTPSSTVVPGGQPLLRLATTGTPVQIAQPMPTFLCCSRSRIVDTSETPPIDAHNPKQVLTPTVPLAAVQPLKLPPPPQQPQQTVGVAVAANVAAVASLKRESDSDNEKQLTINRVAATRCRQKKKQQTEDMEKKAKILQDSNRQLEDEMSKLKMEIDELEALLEEHRDCASTAQPQQQQQQNVYYLTTA